MAYSDFVRHKKWSIISIGSIWSRILLSSQIEYLQTNTEYKKNLDLRREWPKVDGYNMVQINNAKDNKKFTTCWTGKLWLIQHHFHMGITTCHLNSCEKQLWNCCVHRFKLPRRREEAMWQKLWHLSSFSHVLIW